MKTFFTLIFAAFAMGLFAQPFAEWDAECENADFANVNYKVDEIVVRSFDGVNPPPRLDQKEGQLFYAHGMTAYWWYYNELEFFEILYTEAVHRDAEGNEIKRFPLEHKYSDEFKTYFKETLPEEELKNIFFERIYLKDENNNYIHLEKPQQFCPHCFLEKETETAE